MSQRKSAIIVLFIFVAMIYAAGRIVTPFWGKWTAQSQQIQAKDKELKEYQSLMAQEDQLTADFNRLSKQIQAEIPDQREESEFLSSISDVAKKTNVYIETMNPQPFRDFDEFKELSVDIKMDANLGNLTRFLYEMHKSSVVLVVDQLTLVPNSAGSALLKGDLVISTIFLKD